MAIKFIRLQERNFWHRARKTVLWLCAFALGIPPCVTGAGPTPLPQRQYATTSGSIGPLLLPTEVTKSQAKFLQECLRSNFPIDGLSPQVREGLAQMSMDTPEQRQLFSMIIAQYPHIEDVKGTAGATLAGAKAISGSIGGLRTHMQDLDHVADNPKATERQLGALYAGLDQAYRYSFLLPETVSETKRKTKEAYDRVGPLYRKHWERVYPIINKFIETAMLDATMHDALYGTFKSMESDLDATSDRPIQDQAQLARERLAQGIPSTVQAVVSGQDGLVRLAMAPIYGDRLTSDILKDVLAKVKGIVDRLPKDINRPAAMAILHLGRSVVIRGPSRDMAVMTAETIAEISTSRTHPNPNWDDRDIKQMAIDILLFSRWLHHHPWIPIDPDNMDIKVLGLVEKIANSGNRYTQKHAMDKLTYARWLTKNRNGRNMLTRTIESIAPSSP